ncbi:hypothetical protein FN846DRAFT_1021648 [Sphaerosporella brunnea]|uniref:Uncharacterized protein n=1 Tax=Sphaerosporella brunnea TaxID=1250544 RepID=A0A5J5EXK6_9PEZI|nr:hypothetical protein FN846DRAFT_1021648 [Sphaerosporella brunnea]
MSATNKNTAPQNEIISALKLPNINWAANPEYTLRLVQHCTENAQIRDGLFYDSSTSNGKNSSGKSNKYWWWELARRIFIDLPGVDLEDSKHQQKLTGSIGNRLASNTDEDGLSDTELEQRQNRQSARRAAQKNLIERYRAEWPWWDNLHALWSPQPNYNPTGVSNSKSGHDHSASFEKLLSSTPKKEITEGGKSAKRSVQDLESVQEKKARISKNVFDTLEESSRRLDVTAVNSGKIQAQRGDLKLKLQERQLADNEKERQFKLEMEDKALAQRKHEDAHQLAKREAKFRAEISRYPFLLSQ